jgi:multicomponent Na+:H+ antiporter subunit E
MRIGKAVIALTVTYMLALPSIDPWDIGIGAVLALAISVTFRRFIFADVEMVGEPFIRRMARLPALLVATLLEIARGTIDVARTVLSPGGPQHADFVELPIVEQSESGLAINNLLLTLSPGSVLVEVEPEKQSRLMHYLDAADEDAVKAGARRFYDRFQRPVWP